MHFDLPKEKSSIIKVIGVGGGGGNAVNHMFRKGIKGVNFVICNTDAQAMELSPIPNKVQLGPAITQGHGAGSIPESGRKATEESIDAVRDILSGATKMVFVTAGLGGGTGTGGAPVVARIARELGILTVGIVTMPFSSEGKRKMEQARAGMEELKKHVDSLVVICNDKLEEMYGQLRISEAFGHADDVLATAAKGIAEIITVPGYINVDFEDVRTVMAGSGVAIMGSAMVAGEHRATKAISAALSSPLLNDNDIRGAKNILLNITSGTEEVLMSEITDIMNYLQDHAEGTDIIWGNCYDESIGENLCVTLIATGFETNQLARKEEARQAEKVILPLEEKKEPTPIRHEAEPIVEVGPMEMMEEKPNQITFNFDVTQSKKRVAPILNEVKRKATTPTRPPESINEEERKRALRKMSLQLRNPNHLEEVEKTPAYKRNEVSLHDVPSSSETDMSDYSVHEDEGGSGADVRKGNSFIHGAVD